MQILKIFTVFDEKAESYMQPFYMQTTGAAIRAFEDTCNDPASAFNKHPADYTLFEVGTFDDHNAEIKMLSGKIALYSALEVISQGTNTTV